MWPWGHDFMFTNAHTMFDKMDRVITYINNNPSKYNVNVRYGTPAEYFDIIHEKQIAFPVLQQDFLPYGPTVINWWNGYYTSRPLLKARCRQLDSIQRTAEIIYTTGRSSSQSFQLAPQEWQELFTELENVRKVQGIMQHHDAITGTMREHVLLDYYNMIIDASSSCGKIIEKVMPLLLPYDSDNMLLEDLEDILFVTPGSVVDIPKSLEHPKFIVLHNSLPWSRTEMYSITVKSPSVKVYDISRKEFIPSSILPPLPSYLSGMESQETGYRLYFEAKVPSVGLSVYILYYTPTRIFDDLEIIGNTNNVPIIKAPLTEQIYLKSKIIHSSKQEHYIENDEIRIDLDDFGNLKSCTQKTSGDTIELKKDYHIYKSDPAWDNHYTFKALDDGTIVRSNEADTSFLIIRTPLVQEVYQTIDKRISQRITLFKNQNQIQFTDYIGPPDTGINYIARYSSSIRSDGNFYTDDSGLEIVQRTYNSSDIYSGNFYPMIYSSFIREDEYQQNNQFSQISYVSDRTHGITSVHEGTFDIMLHRNSLQSYGNGEKMDDKNTVEIVSWLLVTKNDNYQRQQIAMRRNFPLTTSFSHITKAQADFLKPSASFLSKDFPPDIFLMNFDYNDKTSNDIVFRVNNLRQKKVYDLADQSTQASFYELYQELSLNNIFSKNKITNIEERTLTLNQKVDECKRHHWHDITETIHDFKSGDILFDETGPITSKNLVSLPPLGIRSFFMNLEKKSN